MSRLCGVRLGFFFSACVGPVKCPTAPPSRDDNNPRTPPAGPTQATTTTPHRSESNRSTGYPPEKTGDTISPSHVTTNINLAPMENNNTPGHNRPPTGKSTPTLLEQVLLLRVHRLPFLCCATLPLVVCVFCAWPLVVDLLAHVGNGGTLPPCIKPAARLAEEIGPREIRVLFLWHNDCQPLIPPRTDTPSNPSQPTRLLQHRAVLRQIYENTGCFVFCPAQRTERGK